MDSYTDTQTKSNLTPQEKIQGVHAILKAVKCGMLTTRAQDGALHSRAMQPTTPTSDTQLNLVFIANNVSHKFDEIEVDSHVNVNFYDPSTTNWASFSGRARLSRDQELIKKHWSSTMSAYFGDLKDGIHKGDETDPRVSLIEVNPEEIRYWTASKGTVRQAGINCK